MKTKHVQTPNTQCKDKNWILKDQGVREADSDLQRKQDNACGSIE